MRTLFLALATSATIFAIGVSPVAATEYRYCLHWPFCDMPTDPDDVRFRGKTGSSLPTAKVTRLTQCMDLTGFLTHLRGRSQKFASAAVSRFTSTPHVWSHSQVGHFNVGENNAYPLFCPRDVCDHLRNWCKPGRSYRVSVLPAWRRLWWRGRLCIHQLPAMSGYRIGPHGLLRHQSLSCERRRPDNSCQAASSSLTPQASDGLVRRAFAVRRGIDM